MTDISFLKTRESPSDFYLASHLLLKTKLLWSNVPFLNPRWSSIEFIEQEEMAVHREPSFPCVQGGIPQWENHLLLVLLGIHCETLKMHEMHWRCFPVWLLSISSKEQHFLIYLDSSLRQSSPRSVWKSHDSMCRERRVIYGISFPNGVAISPCDITSLIAFLKNWNLVFTIVPILHDSVSFHSISPWPIRSAPGSVCHHKWISVDGVEERSCQSERFEKDYRSDVCHLTRDG